MATIKEQLIEALKPGEDTETLICFYQTYCEHPWDCDDPHPITMCTFDELPGREFDEGYGGVSGERTIVFSPNFIYVREVYDGAENFAAVPRNPEDVTFIPEIGGG